MALDRPILISPTSGLKNVDVPPVFGWSSVLDSTAYTLQLSRSDTFTNVIFDTSNITLTSREVTGLEYDTLYYWRVRASNAIESSLWSVIWLFTTEIYSSGKIYHIYDSIDDGKTWNFIVSTSELSYELGGIPYNIRDKMYRIIIEKPPLKSYGYVTFPAFSFRRTIDILDNGYWDIDPTSNVYKLTEGTTKDGLCRTELENRYTELDSSILQIRNERISDVYGRAFEQESDTAGEDYRRKIWNLFLGFRNTITFDGVYHVVQAFTHIPPKIEKLSGSGWIVGRRYVGKDTIPLSTLSALYGVFFKVHLFKKAIGNVTSVIDPDTTFDTTTTDYFSSVNDYYKDDFLVFKTGNNVYKSRKITSYSYNIGTGVGRFTTLSFPADTTASDEFFVSDVSTDTIEDYVKRSISLHSDYIFKYYSDYMTENFQTGFAGTVYNLELVPSHRIRVKDVTEDIDDDGKIVQAMYDSGLALTKTKTLTQFGGLGIVCWDMIDWGDTDIEFKMLMTFSDDVESIDWVFQEDRIKYVSFTGLQEEDLDEYIKEFSESVYDTLGNSYIRDVDYIINYRQGAIRRTVISTIPVTTPIIVQYDLVWGEVSQNQILSFTKNYFKWKFVVNNVRNPLDWEFGGFYLKSLL